MWKCGSEMWLASHLCEIAKLAISSPSTRLSLGEPRAPVTHTGRPFVTRSLLLFCRRVGGSSSSKSLRVSTTAVERQQCPRAHFVHVVEIKALSMRVAATNQTKSEAIESGDMPIVPELEFVERMLQQAPQLLVFALVGAFIECWKHLQVDPGALLAICRDDGCRIL